MELTGQRSLPVDRETAWAALNDPELLKAAIPGCESFAACGPDVFEIVVNAAVGPVKARFKGRIRLADLDPPASYRIEFDMQGGGAGFSRGEARVSLAPAGADQTLMDYAVSAQVGGKIAQVGSRLVDAAAATLAERFFASFAARLAELHPVPEGGAAPTVAPAPGWWASLVAFLRRLLARPSQ